MPNTEYCESRTGLLLFDFGIYSCCAALEETQSVGLRQLEGQETVIPKRMSSRLTAFNFTLTSVVTNFTPTEEEIE